jgi:hypothetical protein
VSNANRNNQNPKSSAEAASAIQKKSEAYSLVEVGLELGHQTVCLSIRVRKTEIANCFGASRFGILFWYTITISNPQKVSRSPLLIPSPSTHPISSFRSF